MKRSLPLLVLIVLASSAVSISMFSTGQFWYDDFAGYMLQTKALLHGNMAQFVAQNSAAIAASDYPVGPAAYPWGYPLLIAPLFAFGGVASLTAYKLLNTLAFGAFLVIFYQIARRRITAISALLLMAALAFNPALLQAQDLIQADFIFLFISTLTLLKIEEESSIRRALWLGILLFAAFFVRTNGILLLGIFGADAALRTRTTPQPGMRYAAITTLIFFSLTLAAGWIFPNGQGSYFEHYSLFFSPARLWENTLYYLALPGVLFTPFPRVFPLMVFFFFVGVLRFWREERVALAYILLTLALFITWPERQGLRFLYPILPLWLILAARGLETLSERWKALAPAWFGALATLALFASLSLTGGQFFQRQDINGPFDEYSQPMFAFVREQTAPQSVVIFFKPRLMTLLAERKSLLLTNCARLGAGDYLVLHKKGESNAQIDPQQAETCNPAVKLGLVFDNRRFLIYKILR